MAASPPSKLGAAINNFGLDFYKTLTKSANRENVFFSPLSVATALAMTSVGAKGKTADEMKSVLKLSDFDDATVKASFQDTFSLTSADKGNVLKMANKMFTGAGEEFLPAFLDALRKSFHADAEMVDFAGDTEGSRQKINSWVAEETGQKIKDLLQPGILTDQTAMVLANAVYFKGEWANKFQPSMTNKGTFYITPEETMEIDMMFKQGSFPFGFDPDLNCQMLELPYSNQDLGMVMILPCDSSADALGKLENALDETKMASLVSDLHKMTVMVTLPKFKMAADAALKEPLSTMGMATVFSRGAADLSGMDGTRKLYLDEVVHKACIEVTEEGCEAAAASAAMIANRCMPPMFEACHPFLLVIRNKAANMNLFMGRVVKPEPIQ